MSSTITIKVGTESLQLVSQLPSSALLAIVDLWFAKIAEPDVLQGEVDALAGRVQHATTTIADAVAHDTPPASDSIEP